jgi:hypothetical protein
VTLLAVLALLLANEPAGAVSNGTTDGKLHPNVACVVMQLPQYQGTDLFECASGQLISPTVVLTAGHVTDFINSTSAYVAVTFDPVVRIRTSKLYPVARAVTHPAWRSSNFTNSPDLGVLVLSAPVKGIAPAQLPTTGLRDGLKAVHELSALDVVGYGASFDGYEYTSDDTRRFASETVAAVDAAGTVEMVLNTPGNNGPTGVCFGDSGAPHLLPGTNITVAVQSSARAGCWSTARAWRLDTPIARDFLGAFVRLP